MDCEYAINGQKLDADHCRVTAGSTWLAGISPRRDVVAIPGVHGGVPSPYSPVFDEREITIRIGIAGELAFNAETRRIATLCAMPSVTITRTVDGMTQQAACELKSLAPDTEVYGRVEQLTAVFAMPGVWWRGDDAFQTELPVSGGRLLRGSFHLPAAGYWTKWSGQENNSTSLLANFGTLWIGEPNNSPSILVDSWERGWLSDAPVTDPIIRVPAGVTSISITDAVSGTGISWTGARDSSKPWLYLDPLNLAAWTSPNAQAWTGGADASTGVDYPANGPLQLWPNTDCDYRIAAKTTGTAADATLLIRFRPSWW